MAALTKLQRLTFGLSFPLGEPIVVCSMNSFLYDIIRNSSISPDTHPDLKEITIEISSDESEVPSLPVCRSDWWLDSPREEGMNGCLQDILLQTVKYFKLPYIVFECIDIIYHDNEKAVVTASQLESLAARMFNRLRSLGCIEFRPARGNYLLPLGIWQSVDVVSSINFVAGFAELMIFTVAGCIQRTRVMAILRSEASCGGWLGELG